LRVHAGNGLFFDQLYNFTHWLTQHREEAENLVQEIYVKASNEFSSFQPGTRFRAWMYRIFRNTSNFAQRTASDVDRPLDAEADGPKVEVEHDNAETILMRLTDFNLLQTAIDRLPVPYREILVLCEVEESYQEIAESLSIPIGTVMSRLSRARKPSRDVLRLQFQKG
jgi:RNA polymerase sigma-70 factor (ECF subfamily)